MEAEACKEEELSCSNILSQTKTEKELTEEGERGIGSENVELLLLSSSRCTIYCEGILMLLESACSTISAVSTLGAYSSSHENRGIFSYQYMFVF